MAITSENAGLLTLGATQGIVLFTALLPDRSKVYSAKPTPDIVRDVRHGELIASSLTLAYGGMLAGMTKTMLPLWISAFTAVAMVTAYEFTLARNG